MTSVVLVYISLLILAPELGRNVPLRLGNFLSVLPKLSCVMNCVRVLICLVIIYIEPATDPTHKLYPDVGSAMPGSQWVEEEAYTV